MLTLIAPRSAGDEEGEDQEAGSGGADVFAAIREEPGNVSVRTIEREVFKLGAIKAVGLPGDLFGDIAPGVVLAWRARVAAEAPSHLREHPNELKVTLLAAYLHCRQTEIIDALVDLLLTTVHRINAHADTKVTKEFVAELKRVSGKEDILFRMTGAALEAPDGIVSEAIYPVVPGGVDTLVALWHEYDEQGHHLPAAPAAGVQGLLHQPLPDRPDPDRGGTGVRVDQHRARPDDDRPRADQAVQGRTHQPHQVLRHR
ncbi:MAG: hypothetical protein ACRDS0_24540, partial [Pseudonocardiaceae bacterium]